MIVLRRCILTILGINKYRGSVRFPFCEFVNLIRLDSYVSWSCQSKVNSSSRSQDPSNTRSFTMLTTPTANTDFTLVPNGA